MRRVQRTIVGAALAAALGASLPAAASATDPGLLLDCSDGVVNGDYTREQLREAQGDIPADSSEYGECAQALSAALAAGGSRDDDKPGGGVKAHSAQNDVAVADLDGDGTVTPAERKAAQARRAAAKRDRREIRELASADPVPSATLGEESSEEGGLPTPLLLALIALVAAGGAGGLWYLAQHNERFAAALRRLRS